MADATRADTICSRREALVRGAALLREAGVDNPRLDARVLLAHALGLTPDRLLATLDDPADWGGFATLLRRRAAREPVALIVGRREFWSLSFEVSAATLIPRPDSETVVVAALDACPVHDAPRVLDLGTGTGCLLLAVLSERAAAFGVGIDLSGEATALAARNARALGMAGRSAFVCADWAAPLNGRFDVAICNPPYIDSGDLPGLMPDVARFEPRRALDGGPDGLAAYRRLIPDMDRLLAPDGAAVFEVGEGQADDVARLGQAAGFRTERRRDLGGIERAVVLRRGMG